MTGLKKLAGRLGGWACIVAMAFFACEKTPEHCGDGKMFNPETQFCFGGTTVGKCGGKEYDPTTEGCNGNTIQDKCEDGEDVRLVPKGTPCNVQTYTITATAIPENGGRITRTPDAPNYTAGTSVAVTAISDSGYTFIGWAGASTSTNATIAFVMDSDTSLIAMFNPVNTSGADTYALTTTASPENGGIIVRTPNAQSYDAGTTVTVTATAMPGYTFTGWTGTMASANEELAVTMNSSHTLVANFQQQQQTQTYTLAIDQNPTAGGTVTGAGTYTAGTQVTITAAPANGYTFVNWTVASGTATLASANSANTTVTLNSNTTVTANFQQGSGNGGTNPTGYTLTVNANPAVGGTVLVNNAVSPGVTTHNAGTQVTIRAEAAPLYAFKEWSGALTSTNVSLTINMNRDLTFTANFIGGQFNPDITYDSFTDDRVGRSYRSVKIGNLTWMAENLNYKDHILGNSWCYHNRDSLCVIYGRLYDWDAAMNACPAEWRLPSYDDWEDLIEFAGDWAVAGGKLKSKGGWGVNHGGTDDFGFSALPGGYHQSRAGASQNIDAAGYWWSSTQYRLMSTYGHYLRIHRLSNGYEVSGSTEPKVYGYSVRCVQD